MDERQRELIKGILELNRTYALVPDEERGFRREGQKERVDCFLRVFNGRPQVVVFYGKVRYTWNFAPRAEPSITAALMAITGYHGIENIPPELLGQFAREAVAMRREMLKQRGV